MQEIDDFRPLLGLPDLGRRYDSEQLPPLFAQRVMSSRRRDFDTYASSLGLSRAEATPWEQIVRSGGERAVDLLQFMSMPVVEAGVAHARFLVSGIRHIPHQGLWISGRLVAVPHDVHEMALRRLREHDLLRLVPEQKNAYDECATLLASDGTPVGYVPQVLSAPVRSLLDADTEVEARVVRVNGPKVPPHLRLTVDLRADAPGGFSFDPDGAWEPLAP